MRDGHLSITIAKHRIEMNAPEVRPIHSAPYRAGTATRALQKKELKKMKKIGVMKPDLAEWAAPIIFAPKKDGSLRICVDYRKLSAVTIGDAYAIPRMDECIDFLGDAQVFSKLDANYGYWQVEIVEADLDKTAFTSPHGLYSFVRMLLGVQNAPGTFQRVIDVILLAVRWQHALV